MKAYINNLLLRCLMNKTMFALSIFMVFLLSACANQSQIACTMEAKICPDGSAVGRTGPNCEFEACPEASCNYDDTTKNYIGKSLDECSRIRFSCTEGKEYFSDECGCGCKPSEGKIKVTDCTLEQKQTNACTKEYVPVCGWNNPAKIQCIRYPCAQTYGNKCEACASENVISYSEGECPQ